MIQIFDTHAHYDDESFDDDRERLLAGFPAQGVHAEHRNEYQGE